MSPREYDVPNVKGAALQLVAYSGVANIFRPLTRDAGVVFMLHRFSDQWQRVGGHDARQVRALLAYLRREKYRLVDVMSLLAAIRGEAPPLRHAVAFTIDDGYHEQASLAAPLFAEFDCPVTTFVTTGFLDGVLWFWWDQIEHIFASTARTVLRLHLGDDIICYALPTNDVDARHAAALHFSARCKGLSESARREVIALLSRTAEVEIPERPPRRYAAMTWGELRQAERRGMTFGPHTITHPLLSRVDDESARNEIAGSWARLRAEAARPVPLFAYPNGQLGDFGDREFHCLQNAGISAAVTARVGFVTREHLRAPHGRFEIPRINFPYSLSDLIQQVNGLERFKSILRGVETRPHASVEV